MLLRPLPSSVGLLGSPGDDHLFALEIPDMLFRRDTRSRLPVHAMLRGMALNSSNSLSRNSFAVLRFQRLHNRPSPNGGAFVSSAA